MPNFEAKVRVNHLDIDGLVLACVHSGLSDDGSLWTNTAPPARSVDGGYHDGADNSASLFDSTKGWRTNQLVGKVAYNTTDGSSGVITSNTEHTVIATLSGGTGNDWDADDSYIITTPRCGNPYQDVSANRPVVSTVGGIKQADFNKGSSHYLKIPLGRSFLATEWSCAFEFEKGSNGANFQYILGFPDWDVYRLSSIGNFGYKTNISSYDGVGDMPDGTWAFTYPTSTTGQLLRNGSSALSNAASVVAITSADPAGYIGRDWSYGRYVDGVLRSMLIWNRRLSPLEIDFLYQTLTADGTDYSTVQRAAMVRRVWTDETASVERINPHRVAPHRFFVAGLSTGSNRVQIAAQVDGVTLPDSELGGDLFDLNPIEIPGTAPAVYQDTGWSSVFDIAIEDEGHYTYLLSRENGGAIVIHFDAEDLP